MERIIRLLLNGGANAAGIGRGDWGGGGFGPRMTRKEAKGAKGLRAFRGFSLAS